MRDEGISPSTREGIQICHCISCFSAKGLNDDDDAWNVWVNRKETDRIMKLRKEMEEKERPDELTWFSFIHPSYRLFSSHNVLIQRHRPSLWFSLELLFKNYTAASSLFLYFNDMWKNSSREVRSHQGFISSFQVNSKRDHEDRETGCWRNQEGREEIEWHGGNGCRTREEGNRRELYGSRESTVKHEEQMQLKLRTWDERNRETWWWEIHWKPP